jgi:tetratricopeptide (TPR) repeat protein
VQDLLIFIGLVLMVIGFVCSGLLAQRALKLLSQEEKLSLIDSPSRLRIFGIVPAILIMYGFFGIGHLPTNFRWLAYFGIWLLLAVYLLILNRMIFRRLRALKINSDYQKAQGRALWPLYLGFFFFFCLSTLSSFVPHRANTSEYDAWTYANRGITNADKGKLDDAINDFNQAIRLDPKSGWIYCQRGSAYSSKGDFEKAINDFTRYIELQTNDPCDCAYVTRGYAYSEHGDYDKAISDYNEAIRLNPTNSQTYGYRGYAYSGESEYDKAISDYTDAIRLDPKDAWAYESRGYANRMTGQVEKSAADYLEAKRIKSAR